MITLEERAPSAIALVIAEALEHAIAEATKPLTERIETLELKVQAQQELLDDLEDHIESAIETALDGLEVSCEINTGSKYR